MNYAIGWKKRNAKKNCCLQWGWNWFNKNQADTRWVNRREKSVAWYPGLSCLGNLKVRENQSEKSFWKMFSLKSRTMHSMSHKASKSKKINPIKMKVGIDKATKLKTLFEEFTSPVMDEKM